MFFQELFIIKVVTYTLNWKKCVLVIMLKFIMWQISCWKIARNENQWKRTVIEKDPQLCLSVTMRHNQATYEGRHNCSNKPKHKKNKPEFSEHSEMYSLFFAFVCHIFINSHTFQQKKRKKKTCNWGCTNLFPVGAQGGNVTIINRRHVAKIS